MNDALVHRGPDAEGFWADRESGVFLGHRRLSVIDIAGGSQPMWTADRSLGIVYNGEIYNCRELRGVLEQKGHLFTTDHSDTEVLLHGYREWGHDLLPRLNGMWAFALYDVKKREIFLSRDRFGKKPLYYMTSPRAFIFASELSALVKHPCCTPSVSKLSLKKYFAYNYIPAPYSLYESVCKLPAGHNLVYSLSDKKPRVEKYWEFVLEPFETLPRNAETVWCGELRALLDVAVQRRLAADVPLGVFLSGGIDSTAVAWYAAQHTGAKKCSTFSIGFDEPSFDETEYAHYAATLLGTDHHHRMFSLETARPLLDDIVAKLDEPFGDPSLLPTYLLCKEARRHVTVALGGDGADELFAGYDPFRALHAAEMYHALFPRPVHAAVRAVVARMPVSHVNMSADFRVKRTLRGLSFEKRLWNPVWLGALDPVEIGDLFAEPCAVEEVYAEAIDCWESCAQKSLVDKTMQFYVRMYLQNDILAKIDRASMMHSLEVRSPFLDIDLVDFVRRIPAAYKYRNGRTKYLLKKALEPILPEKILYRKKKGFGIPVGKWFKNGDLSLTEPPAVSGCNQVFVRNQVREHRNSTSDNRAFLWNMWLLDTLLRKRN
jgi:asparagine synthase (glutamine-hydrolysing)